MSPEGQKPIGRNTLRVLKAIGRLDEAVSRATFPFLRWLTKRKGIDMYQVGTLGEEQVLLRRLKPIIEGAVEIRAVEGDFSEGLFSERQWPPDSRVRVTQVPEGSAPEEVRQSWLGVEMDAYRLPPASEEMDLTTGQPAPTRNFDLYAVKLGDALNALGKNSPQAATWFSDNLAPNINALTFAAHEVAIVGK